jgi:hypothetical protein
MLLPCLQSADGATLRVWCPCCDTAHTHDAARLSTDGCARGSLLRWFGYDVVAVDAREVADDAQLARLSRETWLLSWGWRRLPRRRWHHSIWGRYSTAAAVELQQRLDAFASHRLEHGQGAAC